MSSIPIRKRGRQPRALAHAPRTLEQYIAQPTRQQQRLANIAHALTAMRSEGLTLKAAARAYKLDPRTVQKYAGSGLRRGAFGRYVARASDRIPRALAIPAQRGVAEIVVRSSREASKLGNYWVAVQHFLETGDEAVLDQFRGQSVVDASGRSVPLITDPDHLERLGSAGVLSFESIYARVS